MKTRDEPLITAAKGVTRSSSSPVAIQDVDDSTLKRWFGVVDAAETDAIMAAAAANKLFSLP